MLKSAGQVRRNTRNSLSDPFILLFLARLFPGLESHALHIFIMHEMSVVNLSCALPAPQQQGEIRTTLHHQGVSFCVAGFSVTS